VRAIFLDEYAAEHDALALAIYALRGNCTRRDVPSGQNQTLGTQPRNVSKRPEADLQPVLAICRSSHSMNHAPPLRPSKTMALSPISTDMSDQLCSFQLRRTEIITIGTHAIETMPNVRLIKVTVAGTPRFRADCWRVELRA